MVWRGGCQLKPILCFLYTSVTNFVPQNIILTYLYLLLVKLVRGAYIVPEGEYARIGNYPSPVHDSYEDTSRSYNSIADWLLTNISTNQSSRSVRFILATVNKESVQKAVAR